MFLCYRTALRSGGRYIYLWFTTVIHGFMVENVRCISPDVNNLWHAQSMLMLLGRRLPLYIILLCEFSRAIYVVAEVLNNM